MLDHYCEMYQIERRMIKKFQREEITIDVLRDLYNDKENRQIIILIYDNDKLITLLSYEDFLNIDSECKVQFYLNEINNNQIWKEHQIEDILTSSPIFKYLILEMYNGWGIFAKRMIHDNADIEKAYKSLKAKGVHVFKVNIPYAKDVKNQKCHGTEKSMMAHYIHIISDVGFSLPSYIDKITDTHIDSTTRLGNLEKESVLGEGNRSIYLVGPCIIMGYTNPPKETLPEILLDTIRTSGMEYKIFPIRHIKEEDKEFKYDILSNDIKKNDIVIFVDEGLSDSDLDTTDIFNSYCGEKYLFQGERPIHTTVTANKMISDLIMEKIVCPVYESSNEDRADDRVVHYGEPQFTYEDEQKIIKFALGIKAMRCISSDKKIGAIVMNCNPFTYGHRHLVEYAAGQVDYLYIFVVEEDLSAIPFSDRMNMVYEGIKDIPNIVLAPSGKFIISRYTFHDYFNKSISCSSKSTNVNEDVFIFARYIAQILNITKRFVGQEPIDIVTNSYNQKMKEIFPRYGIELVEIPRKKLADGQIINATEVRECLLQGKWDKITQFVPHTTLEYLLKIKDCVKDRILKFGQNSQDMMNHLVQKICDTEKVVIYTMGHDSKGIMDRLPYEVKYRCVYCDKNARERQEDVYFSDKFVIMPEELLLEYKDYLIVVASTKFGADIYEDFVKMGVNISNCIFNQIIFN